MPDEPVAVEPVVPAAPASTPAAPKTDDSVTMTRAELAAFVQSQVDPWQKKHSDVSAEFGKYKKTASLPPEALDAERNFESMKRIVGRLGVPEEMYKDAETVRDLDFILRGYQPKEAAKSPEGDGPAATNAALQEFRKANSARINQTVTTGAPTSGPVSDDDMDKAFNEGRITSEQYRTFLRGRSM